jgi:opacity protein-like surface antigen
MKSSRTNTTYFQTLNYWRNTMKKILYLLLAVLVLSLPLVAQENLEFYGGYRHISGDGGLDGYNVGVGWNPLPRFQLYLTYDGTYDNSTLGTFALTQIGSTLINSHMQELLTGPRYFLPGVLKGHGHVEGHLLIPYVEAGFGEARLHTDLTQVNIAAVQAADTAFVWQIGGGADYRILPHWTARGDLGFLRTHFANGGQGRVRLGLGIVWSARPRATE